MKDRKDITKYLEATIKAVSEAGAMLKKKKQDSYRVIRKEKRELVTELDMFIQEYLSQRLCDQMGEMVINSEEMSSQNLEQDKFWSIDPIDGTHNFIAGLPAYGISVAYIENYEVLFGVIYLPEYETLYHACKSLGAFVNKSKISCSPVQQLSKSIIAYDNQFHLNKESQARYERLVEASFTTRILGSAAVDACYISQGILSARIFNSTKLCDIAAGSLIVEESGGIVTDFSGNKLDFTNINDVIMCTGGIHSELLSVLQG